MIWTASLHHMEYVASFEPDWNSLDQVLAFKLQKLAYFEVLKSDFLLEVFQKFAKCLDTSNTSYVMCWNPQL